MRRFVAALLLVSSACATALPAGTPAAKPAAKLSPLLTEWATQCEADDAKACDALAAEFNSGHGTPKDATRGAALRKKAGGIFARRCAAGDHASCLEVSYRSADPATSFTLRDAACRAGHEPGCDALSENYRHGLGVPKDLAKVLQLEQASCRADEGPHTCGGLMAGCVNGDATYCQALDAACKSGSGSACLRQGWITQDGEGVPKDLAKAAALFDTACRNPGTPSACAYLSLIVVGETPGDRFEAYTRLDRICQTGIAEACFEQARLLELAARAGLWKIDEPHLDPLKDPCAGKTGAACEAMMATTQARLFKHACTANVPRACLGLARSEGVANDPVAVARLHAEAAPKLEAACRSGHGESCVLLGTMYEAGSGVSKDLGKADYFYETALHANNGAAAVEALRALRERQQAP